MGRDGQKYEWEVTFGYEPNPDSVSADPTNDPPGVTTITGRHVAGASARFVTPNRTPPRGEIFIAIVGVFEADQPVCRVMAAHTGVTFTSPSIGEACLLEYASGHLDQVTGEQTGFDFSYQLRSVDETLAPAIMDNLRNGPEFYMAMSSLSTDAWVCYAHLSGASEAEALAAVTDEGTAVSVAREQ